MKDASSYAFHHFGLAVKDFKASLAFYEHQGYRCTEPIIDPIQGVELIFCKSDRLPDIELIKPVDPDAPPLAKFLAKNNEIIYHVCYEVDNIEKVPTELFSENRVFCVGKPQPAVLFDNRLVSFYYIRDVGVIELLQR